MKSKLSVALAAAGCALVLSVGAASLLLGSTSSAQADIIEADFAGTIRGIAPYFDSSNQYYLNPFSTTFTARFVFDTALSTVEQTTPGVYRLTESGGAASASITLAAIGGSPSYGNGPLTYTVSADGATLVWQDGLGPTLANVDLDGYHQIYVQLGGQGAFQHGLCPSTFNPCGTPVATSSNLIGTFPVPGPIVGAGLPGLIFAGGGLLGWWRRKRKAETAA
jgi:hypothetical protein